MLFKYVKLTIFYKISSGAKCYNAFAEREGFMKKEIRTVVFDDELKIEAYRFEGISQPFPNHFHDYYVIGLIEKGHRSLLCKNQTYMTVPGNIMLLNPGDSHSCTQQGDEFLDYMGLNISKEIMSGLTFEVSGTKTLPHFSTNVIFDDEASCYLRVLHSMITEGSYEFAKEENLLLLLSLLLRKYAMSFEAPVSEYKREIDAVCSFMEEHFAERISLEQLCQCACTSKSTLLRVFTREKGVTPYRYLENLRIGKAKKLLEQGFTPAEAALQTGFSDQSHFTNYFSNFIGLTPGAYSEIFLKKRG